MATTANLSQYTELNIEMMEGDTLNATNAKFTDSDSTDYSGYDSGQCLLKTNETDADSAAIVDLNTVDLTLVLGNGFINFDALPALTDGKSGVYYYSIKIKTGTDEYTIMKGTWRIKYRGVN